MIFRRALFNELVKSVVAVFLVLLAITLVTMAIRLLGDAASGNISADSVLAFIGFRMLHYLPVILSLTLFLGTLMTLSRAYRDNEMAVWFVSGLSVASWIRPLMMFSLPVVAGIAAISLYLAPWAQSRSNEYRQALNARSDLAAITPGVFRTSAGNSRVYFVESTGGASQVGNIFVQSTQNSRVGVMVAQQGAQQTARNGDHFLVLKNGRRYEGHAGSPDYRVLEFGSYALRIEPGNAGAVAEEPAALPTAALLRAPTRANLAELHWRIGQPLSALILVLLAIPLSFVNPRAGRSTNLIAAILIYMIYGNILGVFQNWVEHGRVAGWVGLWPVHAAMLALLFALLYRRMTLRPFRLWRRA